MNSYICSSKYRSIQRKSYKDLTFKEKCEELGGYIGKRRARYFKMDKDHLIRLYALKKGLGCCKSSMYSDLEPLRKESRKYFEELGLL